MYPLIFNNVYFNKIWGGGMFKHFRDNIVENSIGESWDLCCHNNAVSIVDNGIYRGTDLKELIIRVKEELIGRKLWNDTFDYNDFPYLIKIISTKDNLSLQVHPGDYYAEKNENSNGKLEAWYILDCEENAEIVMGVKDCTVNEFLEACENEEAERYLNKVKVSPGDLFVIRPGLIHSIGGNILLAEFQQNSDITYRVYDYGRGRELHLEKARDVIDVGLRPYKLSDSDKVFDSTRFRLELLNIDGCYICEGDKDICFAITCVEGQGTITYRYNGKEETLNISRMDTLLIPSGMEACNINGRMKMVKLGM